MSSSRHDPAAAVSGGLTARAGDIEQRLADLEAALRAEIGEVKQELLRLSLSIEREVSARGASGRADLECFLQDVVQRLSSPEDAVANEHRDEDSD